MAVPVRALARALLAVAVGAAAFEVTARGVRTLVPLPPDYRAKLEVFEASAGEYDAVFLGSSRVLNHLRPEVFERELSRLGHELRVFNLGAPGMGAFESDHLLRRVLANGDARLRFVFLEPGRWNPELANPDAARTTEWHTPRQTLTALRLALRGDEPARERLALAFAHVAIGARRAANLGQGRRVLGEREVAPEARRLAQAGRGWRDLESMDEFDLERRRRAFVLNPGELRERARLLPGLNARRVAPDPLLARIAAGQREACARRGATLVPLLPLGTAPTPVPLRMRERGELDVLLAFNAPDVFPELFEERLFFDITHLGREGATLFSRIVARTVAAWLDGREAPGIVRGPG